MDPTLHQSRFYLKYISFPSSRLIAAMIVFNARSHCQLTPADCTQNFSNPNPIHKYFPISKGVNTMKTYKYIYTLKKKK